MRKVEVFGLGALPQVKKGDDIKDMILKALVKEHLELEDGDVIVVTEKIVSKAQGRLVCLDTVTPSKKAEELAAITGKDPRLVELVLKESKEVLRAGEDLLIVETKNGHILANAGLDQSNVEEGFVKLHPEDPDGTACNLRRAIEQQTGRRVGVVISDSAGRPFRTGSVGIALGSSGITALYDMRGEKDLFGKKLESTRVAVADCIASMANLVGGEASEGIPVVILRGLGFQGTGNAADLIRPKEQDIFR